MSKYILFENGILATRYDSEIHGLNIPKGSLEVSDELFFKTISEQDGIWHLIDGKITKKSYHEPSKEDLKRHEKFLIQSKIEALEKLNLMPRPIRDLFLEKMSDSLPSYQKIQELENSIKLLRNTL